jgi:hypothetical protein
MYHTFFWRKSKGLNFELLQNLKFFGKRCIDQISVYRTVSNLQNATKTHVILSERQRVEESVFLCDAGHRAAP